MADPTFAELAKALQRFEVLLSNVDVVGVDDWTPPADDATDDAKLTYLERVQKRLSDGWDAAQKLSRAGQRAAFAAGEAIANKAIGLAVQIKETAKDKLTRAVDDEASAVRDKAQTVETGLRAVVDAGKKALNIGARAWAAAYGTSIAIGLVAAYFYFRPKGGR